MYFELLKVIIYRRIFILIFKYVYVVFLKRIIKLFFNMFNVFIISDIKKVFEYFNFEGKVEMFEFYILKYNCIKLINYFF